MSAIFLVNLQKRFQKTTRNEADIFGAGSLLVFHAEQHRWIPGFHMDNKPALEKRACGEHLLQGVVEEWWRSAAS